MMDGRVRVASRLLALGGLGLLLVGCQSIREAAGITKEPPDEFAVVTKAPLVIPPDFNLKPPKPGASPSNQVSPTASAQVALYGDDPTVIAATMPKTYSDAEKDFLIKTGAATADHSVRQQISAENKQMEASDESFTDKVLFRGPEPDQGKPVDADAETQRISDAKAQGKTTPAAGGTADQPASEKKPDDTPTIKKDEDSGWLDGILGGIF
jgi:hypothetical protein